MLADMSEVGILGPVQEVDGQRRRILDVARRCFEQYGVQRTRMEDIADELGMSRPLLYTFYSTRQKLVDAVVLDYIREFAERVQPRILAADTFAEAVVEGSVLCIEAARENKNLSALASVGKTSHLSEMLLRPTEIAHAMAKQLWSPVIDRARERGEIREDLDEDNLLEWLSGIHLLWWIRDEVDVDHLRAQLRMFLVPALLPPG
jgi:AcrR family transcriptional regulator